LSQLGFWDELRHQGFECGGRERRRRTNDCPDETQLEKASVSLSNQSAQHSDGQRACGVGPEQHGAAAETI
jgi:hypothetical protein